MNDPLISVIEWLFEGSLILGLGFLPGMFQQRSSAAQRSFVWLVLFSVMLALPFCDWMLPSWRTKFEIRLPVEVLVPQDGAMLTESAPANPPEILSDAGLNVTKGMEWLGGFYFVGLVGVIAHRLLGACQVWMLCAKIRFLPESHELCVKVRQACRSNVRLAVSDETRVPMTWGVLKPVIVIPAAIENGCRSRLHAALEHEMAHVRHRDAAWRWLGTLACALWWPLPLIWLAARAWRLEQERACDDWVVRAGHDAGDYAVQLVEAACQWRRHPRPSVSALVMAMPAGLERRLKSIVSSTVNRDQPQARFVGLSWLSGVALLLAGGFCRAETARASAEEEFCFKSLFVEVASSQAREAGLPEEGAAAMSEKKAGQLLDLFSLHGKAKLAKLPKACTKLNQGAMMEVTVDSVIFPTELNNNGLHPATYEFQAPGYSVEVRPMLWRGLQCEVEVESRVLKFYGFEFPSTPGKIVTDRRRVVQNGEIARPLFHFRGWKGMVDLSPGTWVMKRLETLDSSHPLAVTLAGEPRELWLFLCIESVDQAATKSSGGQKQRGKP